MSHNKLAIKELASYGLPALPLAALTLPITIFLPTFYADQIGLGLAATGLILLLARLMDVISDPIIGMLSDRTEHSIGRRKFWILIGAPLTMLSAYFLLIPPEGVGAGYLMLWSIALYIGWTCMILPLTALGAELSDDYHERSKISAWREGMIVAGLLVSLGLVALNQDEALRNIAYFLIIMIPLSMLVFYFGLREKLPQQKQRIKFFDGLTILKNNRPFRHLITAYLVNGLANALPATLFILFVQHVIKMPDQVGPLLFIYFLSGLAGIPLWTWLSTKFGKHKTWCFAMIWACAFFCLAFVTGEGDYHLFLALCVLTGLSLGADLILPASMQADVADIDTLQSGEQRTGLLFALWSMTTKLSLALAAGIAFPILEFGGFTPEKPDAIPLLVCLYALAPILLKSLSIFIMWHFPLDEEETHKNRTKIMTKSL